jgi:hypothetical protein
MRSVFLQLFGEELRGFEKVCAHRSYPIRRREPAEIHGAAGSQLDDGAVNLHGAPVRVRWKLNLHVTPDDLPRPFDPFDDLVVPWLLSVVIRAPLLPLGAPTALASSQKATTASRSWWTAAGPADIAPSSVPEWGRDGVRASSGSGTPGRADRLVRGGQSKCDRQRKHRAKAARGGAFPWRAHLASRPRPSSMHCALMWIRPLSRWRGGSRPGSRAVTWVARRSAIRLLGNYPSLLVNYSAPRRLRRNEQAMLLFRRWLGHFGRQKGDRFAGGIETSLVKDL